MKEFDFDNNAYKFSKKNCPPSMQIFKFLNN